MTLGFAVAASLLVAVLSVIIGAVRHDPRRAIVLNAVGYPLFLIGLGAASELSMEAFWAAAGASLGSLLFTMADHHRPSRQSASFASVGEG